MTATVSKEEAAVVSKKETREAVNEEELPRLEKDCIFVLPTVNTRFPLAIYFCRLCGFHMNTVKCADTHMKSAGHVKAKEDHDLAELLRTLPWPPTEEHFAAVNPILQQMVEDHGRTPAEMEQCFQLANWLTSFFQERLHPGCIVRLYGSSRTGFALQNSNVNLELVFPPEFNHAWALIKAYYLLSNEPQIFAYVESDFSAKWPSVRFMAVGLGFCQAMCVLSVCNGQAVEMSQLLCTYAHYFPLLVPLAQLCRYWAKICRLDEAMLGGLPSYAFDLMLLHYLQQRKPAALPILNEIPELHIEPGTTVNGFYQNIFDKVMQEVYKRDTILQVDKWNLAELWIGFLRFYAIEFNNQDFVVNIRASNSITKQEKDWQTKRFAIEDPYIPNKNIAQTTQHRFTYTVNTFRLSYKYFGETQEKEFIYKFSHEDLTDGKVPEVLCAFCSVSGHMADHCPEKILPPLIPLHPLHHNYKQTLDYFLNDVSGMHAVTMRRLQWQETFRATLENMLRAKFRPDAHLSLFGSSCNGFGFVHSDLDLCLTFDNCVTLKENEDALKIIKTVSNALKKDPSFRDVLPVTRAKVPIVRFYHAPSKLEGDISLYNCLALRNTELLRTYSLIDSRVRSLGYIVKVFAKSCEIGDASRGSLSSYAYVLMMLHYLQNTDPPVIPVLQEVCDHRGRRPYIVDGWDTYFHSDLRTLPRFWEHYGKNHQSLHDLWLGFLRYYTEVFDASTFVIQMRTSTQLTKFEKLWSDKPFAIEDPFNLNHNLASGLSWRMYIYIIKVFIHAREVFGHPRHEKMLMQSFGQTLTYDALELYFFDRAIRPKEPPPRDRVCKFCGHVGHFVEKCPEKEKKKKHKKLENKEMTDGQADEKENKKKSGNEEAPGPSKNKDGDKPQPNGPVDGKGKHKKEGNVDGKPKQKKQEKGTSKEVDGKIQQQNGETSGQVKSKKKKKENGKGRGKGKQQVSKTEVGEQEKENLVTEENKQEICAVLT